MEEINSCIMGREGNGEGGWRGASRGGCEEVGAGAALPGGLWGCARGICSFGSGAAAGCRDRAGELGCVLDVLLLHLPGMGTGTGWLLLAFPLELRVM